MSINEMTLAEAIEKARAASAAHPDVPSVSRTLLAELEHLRARVAELEAALRGLSDMYTHTWDCSTGDLLMMAASIPRFEAAHSAARAALGKPDIDDDPEPPK